LSLYQCRKSPQTSPTKIIRVNPHGTLQICYLSTNNLLLNKHASTFQYLSLIGSKTIRFDDDQIRILVRTLVCSSGKPTGEKAESVLDLFAYQSGSARLSSIRESYTCAASSQPIIKKVTVWMFECMRKRVQIVDICSCERKSESIIHH
jgi:hypothetical protein